MNCDVEIFHPISTLMTWQFLPSKNEKHKSKVEEPKKEIGFRSYCFNGPTKKPLESNNLWPPGQRLLVCQCNIPVSAFASFIKWELEGNALVSVAHWEEQAAQKITGAASLLAKLPIWRAQILLPFITNTTCRRSEEGCKGILLPDICMWGSSLGNKVSFQTVSYSLVLYPESNTPVRHLLSPEDVEILISTLSQYTEHIWCSRNTLPVFSRLTTKDTTHQVSGVK